MKSQVRSVLFAAVAMLGACGGEREAEVFAPPLAAAKPELISTDQPAGFGTPPVAAATIVAKPVALPATYAEALELGKALVAKSSFPQAREALEHAAKLDKKQPAPHIELARLYIATKQRALAIREANKAVKLAPESSIAYNTLGRAELARFSYDNAIVAFRQATELEPDNVWAWNNLGYTYLQLEQYQEAADALAEATTRPGTTAYMWNNLGTAHEQLDQLDEAREAYEAGGLLGSKEARASRKRLEGVDTIVVMRDDDEAESGDDVDEHSYDIAEPMPEDDEVVEVDASSEEAVEELDAEAGDGERAEPLEDPPVTDMPDEKPVVEAPPRVDPI
ncbi:MAG: tetratricopeptide repeat protein [Kofleriaceae bacterium]